MDESQFRNKIHWFTFVFSILVVWVHSYNSELFLGRTPSGDVVYKVEHFLGDTIAQIAVPGFFMISAYLFYRNFTWDKLWSKWNSRIKSVLIPFIVWNTLYYLGYLLSSRMPVMTDVVGRGSVPYSLNIAVEAILHYTYNPVFWYLYQLILMIFLSPVIYLLLNRYSAGFYLSVLIYAIYRGWSLPQLNLDALLYYSFAAFAAIHIRERVENEWKTKRLAAMLMILTAVICLWLKFVSHDDAFYTVLYRLLTPTALWLLIDSSRLPKARPWMKVNFFLYAVHFALVRFINKAGALLLPAAPAVPVLLYLMMPVVIVYLSYTIAKFLRLYLPAIWRLLNGSRL